MLALVSAALIVVAPQATGLPPRNLERLLGELSGCPTYEYFERQVRGRGSIRPTLIAICESMSLLADESTTDILRLARFLHEASYASWSPQRRLFESWCRKQNPALRRFDRSQLSIQIQHLAVSELSKLFFVGRFLFDAPTKDKYTSVDRDVLHVTAAYAIGGHFIDRSFPFRFSAKSKVDLAQTSWAGRDDLWESLPLVEEVRFYARHFARRKTLGKMLPTRA